MKEIPCDIEAWIEYTQQNYPFVDLQINRDLVDTLVEAGLDEFFVTGDAQPRGVLLPSILVLPFANLSGDPEQEYFSDGITAGLILALGHFEGIVIKSQQTGFAFKNSDLSSSEIAEKIDADFLVEGTIRKSAQRVRLSVQLIEAQGGSQIWGHQYDEELEDILELEQKLSQALAATIHGRLGHRIQQSAARKPAKDLKSYDHLMRGLYHFGKFTAKDMALAREEIEKCLAGDPENVLAHTNLAEAYVLELIENWAEDGAVTEAKARHHFETALELDPDSSLAHAYYADFLDFLRESEKTWFHADRAIEINPNSAEGHAVRTHLLSCERRHEEALHSADVCLQLDPYSVGSNWAAGVAYRNAGRYAEAIRVFRRIPHPPPTINAYVAGCFVAMGLVDEARAEMQRFLQISRRQMLSLPANADAWREYWRGRALFRHPEDYEKFFTQLLEAGLCDEAEDEASAVPSIAVLPFENLSGDPEQEHFADGITADLVDTLSRFAHLRTVSRYSTLQYKTDRPSIGDIAQQQQVRYILEGSVRRSGGKIRVNAELIDSRDGKILWSERYDRDLDDLFAVQDELTQSIALAMKVQLDDGEMARIRSRGATSIKAWELTMAAVDLQDTYIRNNLLEARKLAREATRVDPDYAYAWISLGWTHWQEVYSGWEVSLEDSIAEAEKALARAREIEPEYSEAYGLSGMIQLMKHDTEAAIRDCLRAVELEPGNAEIQALAAFTHVFAGEYEKGRSYERQVRRLCPVRANWYFLIDAQIEVASGNFERAAELYHDGIAVEPESPLCRFFLVDLMLRTGDEKAARGYADEIRALDAKVSGRGIVLTYSADPALRRTFHDHLAKFDLV